MPSLFKNKSIIVFIVLFAMIISLQKFSNRNIDPANCIEITNYVIGKNRTETETSVEVAGNIINRCNQEASVPPIEITISDTEGVVMRSIPLRLDEEIQARTLREFRQKESVTVDELKLNFELELLAP